MPCQELQPSGEAGGFHVCHPRPLRPPQGLALLSDLHIGGSHTDYTALEAELSDARQRGDRVLINGDLFDLILPGDKKRYRPSDIHPRLQGCNDLVNKAVDWAYELLSPVAEQLDLIGQGNHESACEQHHSTDPILLLVDRLNSDLAYSRSPHRVAYGGYSGFVVYRPHLTLYYHHGWGKGASPSAGAGDLNRVLQTVEGVDLVWLGHRHCRMSVQVSRISPPSRGHGLVTRPIHLVRTGSYVRAHWPSSPEQVRKSGRQASYAVDAGLAPTGLGGTRVLVLPDGSLRVEQ